MYKDTKSGAAVVLSQAAQVAILSQIPPDQLREMGQEELQQKLVELLEGSEWAKLLLKIANPQDPKSGYIQDPSSSNTIIFDVLGGRERVLFFTWEYNKVTTKFRKLRGYTQVLIAEGEDVYAPPSTRIDYSPSYLQWGEGLSTLVFHDGYQIRKLFGPKARSWRSILPHERQYILSPDQQIQYIVHKLRTEKSAYNEPYVFDDYITTKRRDDVPQIVILVTNTQVSAQEQQWINDWFLNDGKNLTPEQKQRVQALIPKIGNGFTRRQAEAIARWIDQLLDQSEYAREIFRIADVRFIAQDNEGLSKLTGTTGVKYAADPNNYNRSLWGIEGATYYPELASLIIAHETARVYCHQTVGPGYNEERDMKPVEQRLLKEAPPPFSF